VNGTQFCTDTSIPISSFNSRTKASAAVSSVSNFPPGNSQLKACTLPIGREDINTCEPFCSIPATARITRVWVPHACVILAIFYGTFLIIVHLFPDAINQYQCMQPGIQSGTVVHHNDQHIEYIIPDSSHIFQVP